MKTKNAETIVRQIQHRSENQEQENFKRRYGYSSPGLPGFFHTHSLDDFAMIYLDEEAQKEFEVSMDVIRQLGFEFIREIVHPEDLDRCMKVLMDFAKEGDEGKTMTYFQRLKFKPEAVEPYQLVVTSVQLNLKENTFECMSNTTDQMPVFSMKISNALSQREDAKKCVRLFLSLTHREKEIIDYLQQGTKTKGIAGKLYLSPRTIEQHKKNIYRKLNVNSLNELMVFMAPFNRS